MLNFGPCGVLLAVFRVSVVSWLVFCELEFWDNGLEDCGFQVCGFGVEVLGAVVLWSMVLKAAVLPAGPADLHLSLESRGFGGGGCGVECYRF